ncbi:MAG: hydrogenase nickel incorporation protein HypB [Chloroflexota bacterium]
MCGPNSNHHHGHDHSYSQAYPNNGALNDSVNLNIDLMLDTQLAANQNQTKFDTAGIHCFNLMSSPGTGKTTLLEQTLARIQPSRQSGQKSAVIEGDMTTELDADRLRAYGVPVIAVTTGRACHLDAELVSTAIDQLDLSTLDIVFIENVGNLVCPAEFPLGAHQNVVLVSVTEGDDKPLKYPVMFHEADCVVITKTDLAPYVRADVERLAENVRQIRPGVPIFALSAETGDGMDEWVQWLRDINQPALDA